MELPPFDPVDFKKFTDGKCIIKVRPPLYFVTNDHVQDTDMDPLVENEAKLHITNGIEKASGIAGVDVKVSNWPFLKRII